MTKRRLRWVSVVLSVVLVLALVAGCAGQKQQQAAAPEPSAKPAKDKIVIGQAISLSGPMAMGVATTSGPVYEMWVKEVNAQGGIYVKEYDKKLPIEYVKYDDKSDLGTMTKLLEKLILEDKVDFVLPPWSTGFLYAAAPIANKHQYILIGGPGGAVKLEEIMPQLPYFFQVLNFSRSQMPVLAQILNELGIKSIAVVHHEDLHGVEYKEVGIPELQKAGLDIKMVKSFPLGSKDLSPLLKEAKSMGAEAFIAFCYPEETMLLTQQAIELGINFKAFFCTVGPYAPTYRDAFGAEAVEGVMGGGAWNEKSSPGAAQFVELYKKHFNREPDDYWGQLYYYSSLQHFQQAIEEAGTLDQSKIREVMATKTYDTFVGPFKYDPDRYFRGHLGQIGQWQKGHWEVIDPGKNRTAPPILKPDWPKKK
ncbi:MAG: amino acid ABC transporter substrate-binding protein [Clostridia bacterium]|nr:amino acid ABC transporter substrate-binding protein [Clostridia bacterium]MDH7573090.1 amino acid ABC transporter substrate-binding protein [Clostridia bacterium]